MQLLPRMRSAIPVLLLLSACTTIINTSDPDGGQAIQGPEQTDSSAGGPVRTAAVTSADAGVEAEAGGQDATPEASMVDAGGDSSAAADATTDATTGDTADAGVDAGSDATTDVAVMPDAPDDTASDAGSDVSTDAGPDVSDSGPTCISRGSYTCLIDQDCCPGNNCSIYGQCVHCGDNGYEACKQGQVCAAGTTPILYGQSDTPYSCANASGDACQNVDDACGFSTAAFNCESNVCRSCGGNNLKPCAYPHPSTCAPGLVPTTYNGVPSGAAICMPPGSDAGSDAGTSPITCSITLTDGSQSCSNDMYPPLVENGFGPTLCNGSFGPSGLDVGSYLSRLLGADPNVCAGEFLPTDNTYTSYVPSPRYSNLSGTVTRAITARDPFGNPTHWTWTVSNVTASAPSVGGRCNLTVTCNGTYTQ